ncbi:xanthine dehydrogenase FAD-binding subunit XdhB [Aeromonas diversa]|uniref:xanthine dehydrogenase FAD-binding subunit XdhB n=1 Tax=Aeromonas diversa TaxID=502790 RepID=UPI0039A1705D
MFDIRAYHRATSVAEAVALLGAHPGTRLVAGGTDVMIRLHHLSADYGELVDIHELPELRGIRELSDGTVRIGSGTTFTEIIESDLVRRRIPMLAEAAATIAGPQVRNVATYGGNLCNGATSADSAAPSLALEARLEIAGPEGTRLIPLAGFHTGPGRVALAPAEVLVAIHIAPDPESGVGSHYFKYVMRDAMDIATIGCAAWCRIGEGRILQLRLAYGVAAPTPIRTPHAEALAEGAPLTDATLAAIARAVVADVAPRSSWRAEKDFRLHLIKTLAERVVRCAITRAGGEIL